MENSVDIVFLKMEVLGRTMSINKFGELLFKSNGVFINGQIFWNMFWNVYGKNLRCSLLFSINPGSIKIIFC